MAAGPGYGMPAYGEGHLRASTADRERAVDVLKAGYAEGRLTKEEYDARVGRALAASTQADLATITADLPGGQLAQPPGTQAGTNTLAVVALLCGLGQPFTGFLTTIPAIVLGHMARREIRRTGEAGKGLATAGLVLGWSVVVLALLLVLAVVGFIAAVRG